MCWRGTWHHQDPHYLCVKKTLKYGDWLFVWFFFCLKVTKTEERINTEKLKAREQIMFFDEVVLFEDELHDHGVSMISVKIVSAMFM